MQIRFYGRLGEQLGTDINVDPPEGTDTILKLRAVLGEMFPDASADIKQRTRVCVADSIVDENHVLAGTETIEFFPPLSGG